MDGRLVGYSSLKVRQHISKRHTVETVLSVAFDTFGHGVAFLMTVMQREAHSGIVSPLTKQKLLSCHSRRQCPASAYLLYSKLYYSLCLFTVV